MILYIILGVVLWQLLSTVCFLIVGKDTDKAIPFACGVWTLPVLLISKIWKRAMLFYYHSTCNVYELYSGNEKTYTKAGQAIINNNVAKKLRQDRSIGYHVRKVEDCKSLTDKPSPMHYISKRHLPPMYREFVRLAQK